MDRATDPSTFDGTETGDGQRASGACRDLEAALAALDGIEATAVRRAAADLGPSTAVVPSDHEMTVFEVAGLGCRSCEALVETVIGDLDGVSNVSACHRTGTVRIDYDPDTEGISAARERLSKLEYPIRSRDEAFANRRERQWTGARFAAGVLAGSMVLLPYVAVVYPSRMEGLFYHAAGGQHLADLLASPAGTHFYINLAVLTGVVLFFTGKPILDRACADLRNRTLTAEAVAALAALAVYAYSSLVAFTDVGGAVHYDVALVIVIGATIARRVDLAVVERAIEPDHSDAVPEERPPAMTDGGRTNGKATSDISRTDDRSQ